MRDRMERLVVLPFSMGCSSQSSVAVIEPANPKKPKSESRSSPPPADQKAVQGEESLSAGANCKNSSSLGLLPLPKPNFGIQRLIKSFKNFSQLFVYKEEVEEMEMEIGFPTDVKHVTHIGWDGSANTNPLKGWESLRSPELLSLPSLSLRQFELAMAAQSNNTPLVLGSSKA